MAQCLLSSPSRSIFRLCSVFSRGRANENAYAWDCTRKDQIFSYSNSSGNCDGDMERNKASTKPEWLTLPPFLPNVDVGALGKRLMAASCSSSQEESPTLMPMTALKWVSHCCPDIPHSLIRKLFRLRQIRMECLKHMDSSSQFQQDKQKPQLKRVLAEEIMKPGTKLYLPGTVCKTRAPKKDSPVRGETFSPNADEIEYLQSLEIYKDPAIIVLNKPPGLPVQGGPGIRKSVDVLAVAALRYDYKEGPRLVHRLDKECSGVLVMARTRESAALLHSVFREKTATVSNSEDLALCGRKLKRRYWALVIGIPKQKQGRIDAPLTKVLLDDGKSERILLADYSREHLAQDAITDYRVIGPSVHGCTWLELCTFTGRKHQVRVHCAEALGTPIVGDYKYGWSVHRSWRPISQMDVNQEVEKQYNMPHEVSVENGSVVSKEPLLHLHCRQITLPNVTEALEQSDSVDQKQSKPNVLRFVAPLPSHMATSWDFMSSCIVSQQK